MKYYRVDFSYPDRHVEELFDEFKSAEDAVAFGEDLRSQVLATEVNRGGGFDPSNTYFLVYEYEGNERKLVYRSR